MKRLFSTVLTIVWSVTGFLVFGQSLVFNYTSPISGAEYINPEQSIILKTGIPFDQKFIDGHKFIITGSESGLHSFSWKLSEDTKTLVIIPEFKFSYGETVTVNIPQGLITSDGSEISGTDFSFRIKTKDNLPLLKEFYRKELIIENSLKNTQHIKKPSGILKRDYKLPTDYPAPEMINYEETDDKYLFFTLNPRAGAPDYNHYLSINDEYGTPLFFRKTQIGCLNFHKMIDGRLAYAGNDSGNPENGKYYFMDSSYVVIDSVKTGNGYNMDGHDMLLMENGHYLLMSYDPQIVDMSQYVLGGNPNATVVGLVIQEVDVNETVYFQWRSWDHFQITDATDDINLQGSNIDYVHGNAFAFDLDGNLLISSRHLDEITKINYETGDIIYRFGLLSKNNQFVINNDPVGFSHQHDVKVLPNGNITIFDNGNLRPAQYSQALEYSIDEISMTASRVWHYQNDPNVYGASTGSYRRTGDGKNLIGWGSTWPLAAIEILTDQTKVFEVYLPDRVVSYRVIKDEWVTNLFKAPPQLHFGNYEGNTGPIFMILPVHNNSDELIRITSTFNHNEVFEVIDDLPINIPAGDTIELNISFMPDQLDAFNDRLTLNYDNFTMGTLERIARQVSLCGIWDNSTPVVTFLPEYGTNNVDPESNINIMFSKPVRKVGGELIQNDDIPDLFSFNVSNIWGDDVSFTGIISDDRQQITLIPDEPMAEEQQYFVKLLQSTIEDDDGYVIEHPESTVFITGLFVSLKPGTVLNRVMFFPSPFSDILVVTSKDHYIGNICIYDMSGMEIFNVDTGKNRLEINTSHFPEGIYLVKVFGKFGEVNVTKVVKVH